MSASLKLMPGSIIPDVQVALVGGGSASVRPDGSRPKLVVVYRGAFCPFCRGKALTAMYLVV